MIPLRVRRLRSPRGALQSAAWIPRRDADGMSPGSPAHSESGGFTDLDLKKNINNKFLLLGSYFITGLSPALLHLWFFFFLWKYLLEMAFQVSEKWKNVPSFYGSEQAFRRNWKLFSGWSRETP